MSNADALLISRLKNQISASEDISAVDMGSDGRKHRQATQSTLHLSESALQEHDRSLSAMERPSSTTTSDSYDVNVPRSSTTIGRHDVSTPSRTAFVDQTNTISNTLSPMERFAILSPQNDPCPWETRKILNELLPESGALQALEATLYDAAVKAVDKAKRSTKSSSSLAVIGIAR